METLTDQQLWAKQEKAIAKAEQKGKLAREQRNKQLLQVYTAFREMIKRDPSHQGSVSADCLIEFYKRAGLDTSPIVYHLVNDFIRFSQTQSPYFAISSTLHNGHTQIEWTLEDPNPSKIKSI